MNVYERICNCEKKTKTMLKCLDDGETPICINCAVLVEGVGYMCQACYLRRKKRHLTKVTIPAKPHAIESNKQSLLLVLMITFLYGVLGAGFSYPLTSLLVLFIFLLLFPFVYRIVIS